MVSQNFLEFSKMEAYKRIGRVKMVSTMKPPPKTCLVYGAG
jgi:hypothetical protein